MNGCIKLHTNERRYQLTTFFHKLFEMENHSKSRTTIQRFNPKNLEKKRLTFFFINWLKSANKQTPTAETTTTTPQIVTPFEHFKHWTKEHWHVHPDYGKASSRDDQRNSTWISLLPVGSGGEQEVPRDGERVTSVASAEVQRALSWTWRGFTEAEKYLHSLGPLHRQQAPGSRTIRLFI